MNDAHHTQSPLRLVRVGLLALTADCRVTSGDEAAAGLMALPLSALREGKRLVDLVRPADAVDVEASMGPPPFNFLGLAASSTPLLIHVSCIGEQCIASVTSVNEYLVESQALARVQLRNTVESIISGFAHEVRNPIAAILSLSEAAMMADPDNETGLARIPMLVSRVESLIRQALAYSRPKPPVRSLHTTTALIDHAINLLRPRDTPVRLDVPPVTVDVPPVMVDMLQCEQVLVNLVENALDAARSVVRVAVRPGRTPAPSVCIEVSDDGPGVSSDLAERIFEPFFTTKAHGTGLGLAIARDLTRLNGGELRHVVDAPHGATFRVYLPSTAAPIRGHW
ncbi:MAG: sensor histidine kinase [Archangium sp.]